MLALAPERLRGKCFSASYGFLMSLLNLTYHGDQAKQLAEKRTNNAELNGLIPQENMQKKKKKKKVTSDKSWLQ